MTYDHASSILERNAMNARRLVAECDAADGRAPAERRDYFALAARTESPLPLRVVARALERYETEPATPVHVIVAEAGVGREALRLWIHAADMPTRPTMRRDLIEQAGEAYDRLRTLRAVADELGIRYPAARRRVLASGRTLVPHAETCHEASVDQFVPDPGYVTVRDAAARIGVTPRSIRSRCLDGRIPNARLVEVRARKPHPAKKRKTVWQVPLTWVEERATRAPRARGAEERLTTGPLIAWIDAQSLSLTALAQGDEITERSLRRVVGESQRVVTIRFAERFLLGHNVRLHEVWDDVERAISDADRIHQAHQRAGVDAANAKNRARLDALRADQANAGAAA